MSLSPHCGKTERPKQEGTSERRTGGNGYPRRSVALRLFRYPSAGYRYTFFQVRTISVLSFHADLTIFLRCGKAHPSSFLLDLIQKGKNLAPSSLRNLLSSSGSLKSIKFCFTYVSPQTGLTSAGLIRPPLFGVNFDMKTETYKSVSIEYL